MLVVEGARVLSVGVLSVESERVVDGVARVRHDRLGHLVHGFDLGPPVRAFGHGARLAATRRVAPHGHRTFVEDLGHDLLQVVRVLRLAVLRPLQPALLTPLLQRQLPPGPLPEHGVRGGDIGGDVRHGRLALRLRRVRPHLLREIKVRLRPVRLVVLGQMVPKVAPAQARDLLPKRPRLALVVVVRARAVPVAALRLLANLTRPQEHVEREVAVPNVRIPEHRDLRVRHDTLPVFLRQVQNLSAPHLREQRNLHQDKQQRTKATHQSQRTRRWQSENPLKPKSADPTFGYKIETDAYTRERERVWHTAHSFASGSAHSSHRSEAQRCEYAAPPPSLCNRIGVLKPKISQEASEI